MEVRRERGGGKRGVGERGDRGARWEGSNWLLRSR